MSRHLKEPMRWLAAPAWLSALLLCAGWTVGCTPPTQEKRVVLLTNDRGVDPRLIAQAYVTPASLESLKAHALRELPALDRNGLLTLTLTSERFRGERGEEVAVAVTVGPGGTASLNKQIADVCVRRVEEDVRRLVSGVNSAR